MNTWFWVYMCVCVCVCVCVCHAPCVYPTASVHLTTVCVRQLMFVRIVFNNNHHSMCVFSTASVTTTVIQLHKQQQSRVKHHYFLLQCRWIQIGTGRKDELILWQLNTDEHDQLLPLYILVEILVEEEKKEESGWGEWEEGGGGLLPVSVLPPTRSTNGTAPFMSFGFVDSKDWR